MVGFEAAKSVFERKQLMQPVANRKECTGFQSKWFATNSECQKTLRPVS
jgi:hypothetical protein